MGKLIEVQPAVKKETTKVFFVTLAGVVLMWIVFFVLHRIMPEDVPFDLTVILGGLGGLLVAVLNFFWMGITVQKVAASEDEKQARSFMKLSYTRRILMQIIWIVISLALPTIQWVAGIVPLLFPSAGIKIKGIFDQRKYNRQEVEQKQDEC